MCGWELLFLAAAPNSPVERKRNAGATVRIDRVVPDFAEFIIGPAKGRTRWLNPGYTSSAMNCQRRSWSKARDELP
jgi:hypothetical protein